MNKLCGIAVAIALVASPLAWAAPLSPGKPAGVHHSQMTTSSWVVAGGLGAIALTVIAVAASGDDQAAQSPATSTATSS
ncbi:MAG TPA: hypothetical protein VEV64_08965 [Rhizomicrobium sp.]|jgi:hypothetical protein|nr:hypothetical protein [Rhizomicrobium sp.]